MKISLFLVCLCLLIALPAIAQEHDHAMDQMGTVHFPVSCNEAAQAHFDHAVAILHSFGYEEAELAFRAVAGADPNCAMAYWGMAMTHYHPVWGPPTPDDLKKGAQAIETAKSTGKPTEREKAYINALDVFYKDSDKTDNTTRGLAYRKAMERVSSSYPDDDEAAIFYALALRGTVNPSDRTYAVQKQSAEILNRVLKKHPEHPGIAHYLIHDYDYPGLAQLALPAARVYAKLAPSSPHALHMPSHIFTRLGLWQESIQSNLASKQAAIDHTQKLHPGSGSFDQLHAMDYLMYAYMQTGQYAEGAKVLAEMKAITKVDRPELAAGYALAAIPARYAVEQGHWTEAAALKPGPEWFPWKQFPWAEAITYFARGIGAARSGNLERASKDLARLDELRQAALDLKDHYWAGQIEIQAKAVAAWITLGEKKTEEALKQMRATADLEDNTDKNPVTPGVIIPARELLGDMLVEANQAAQAIAEYKNSLERAPGRLHPLVASENAAKLSAQK